MVLMTDVSSGRLTESGVLHRLALLIIAGKCKACSRLFPTEEGLIRDAQGVSGCQVVFH